MKLRIKKLDQGVPTPVYKTTGSAGFDLHANINESVRIVPNARQLIPTGLAFSIPEGYEGQVRPRSGLAAKFGIGIVNTPGTIDADYRGEVGVILINLGRRDFVVHPGDRIAQMVIAPVTQVEIEEVPELDETSRGSGGYGSTGV